MFGLILVSAHGQDSVNLNEGILEPETESLGNSSLENDSIIEQKKPFRRPSEKFKESDSRTSQFDKRLGLTSRKRDRIDPQIFAQRGRDLQNQFYVIGGSARNRKSWASPASDPNQKISNQGNGKQWLYWVGAAGLAGATAGVTGFLLLDRAHPTQSPAKVITLTDQP